MTIPPESTAARLARIRAAVTNGLGLTYGDAAFLLSQLHAAERERNDALRALGIGSNGQWGAVASEAAYEAAKRAMADEPSPAAGLMAALNAGLAQTLREHEERVAEARKRAWEAEHRAEVTLVELAAYKRAKAEKEWLARQHDTAVAALNKALEDAQRLQGERDEARAQCEVERVTGAKGWEERDGLAARVAELERMEEAARRTWDARLLHTNARIAVLESLLQRCREDLLNWQAEGPSDPDTSKLLTAIDAALSAPAQPEASRWPTVDAFADVMRAKLDANAHKGGWDYDTADELMGRLREETNELAAALSRRAGVLGMPDAQALTRLIGEEAADVANFAMMVADACGALKPAQPEASEADKQVGAVGSLRARIATLESLLREAVSTLETECDYADVDASHNDPPLLVRIKRALSPSAQPEVGHRERGHRAGCPLWATPIAVSPCTCASPAPPEPRRDERHIGDIITGSDAWRRVPAPQPAPDTRVCPDCGRDAPRSRLGGYACACGKTFAGSMLWPQPASAEAGGVCGGTMEELGRVYRCDRPRGHDGECSADAKDAQPAAPAQAERAGEVAVCPGCGHSDVHDPEEGCLNTECDCWADWPAAHAPPAEPTPAAPVPMVLTCPRCRARHIDEGEFATKVHHTHSCQACGHTWRPAVVPTVGVQFLPGFKNDVPAAPVADALVTRAVAEALRLVAGAVARSDVNESLVDAPAFNKALHKAASDIERAIADPRRRDAGKGAP